MIHMNFASAKALALGAAASAYSLIMLISLSGINGAAVGQLIV